MAGKASRSFCSGVIGVCMLCITVWLGYTICLLVQSVPVIKSFNEFQSSPNASKTLSALAPAVIDPQYFMRWMRGLLVLIYLPQYLLAVVYISAMLSAFIDIYCRSNIRAQFITAFISSVLSVSFFLCFTVSLLAVVISMYFIHFMQYTIHKTAQMMIQLMKANQDLVSASDISEEKEYENKLTTALQWLSAEVFFMVMMFITYLVYFCYWPHSLRFRQQKERYASKVGPQDSDDDL